MTEGGTVQNKVYNVGDMVAGRFKIDEVTPQLGRYQHYRATDTEHQNHKVVLSQIGHPTKENEPDKVKRGLERATRALSWVRHPGFVVPREFTSHDGVLFSVFPDVRGTLLDDYIRQNDPPVKQMVHWIQSLTEMLEQIHEASRPQFIGQLPLRNVMVNADGEVQLLGFDLNPDLKLEFIPASSDAPKPPEERPDARTDVWCLGKLMQQMVEVGGENATKQYKEENDLRALVATMLNDDPEKRIVNMSTLKSRLERLGWKNAPKPPTGSVVDQPITVLTVEEEDQFKDIKQKFKLMVGLTIVAMLLVMLIGQMMFPEASF
jgi:hypothetical protein